MDRVSFLRVPTTCFFTHLKSTSPDALFGPIGCQGQTVRVYFIDLDYPADFCFIPPPRCETAMDRSPAMLVGRAVWPFNAPFHRLSGLSHDAGNGVLTRL
jgi:hypothetical protein